MESGRQRSGRFFEKSSGKKLFRFFSKALNFLPKIQKSFWGAFFKKARS
jgi:hypothetical protein